MQRVLAKLEATGIAIDLDLLGQLQSQFADLIRDAAEAAYEVIGKQINLGSPKQLQVVLFDELEMPKTKRTKTGYTTDADALQGLFDKTGHPFLQHLLAHRDATRLKVTVDGLLNAVGSDGRIHTTFNQTIAATGRLSSTEPNLQNIPIRTEAGRQIREGFVVGAGYTELMTADYSQIEMRIMAHLSQDEGLHRGVQYRRGPAFVRRLQGVRRSDRRGDRRAAPSGQGHVLRIGLRVECVRAGGPAEDLHRGGQGADGRLLLALRRSAGLPAVGRRPGPQGWLHLDGPRQASLSSRVGQQQPQRQGGRRAGRAERTRSRAVRRTSSRWR